MSWYFFLSSFLAVGLLWQNASELRLSVCACMCLVWRMSLFCTSPIDTKKITLRYDNSWFVAMTEL